MRFGQPLGTATGALLLVHGRGSSPSDIAGLAEALEAEDFACLAPGAAGGTWYPQRFLAPLALNEPDLTEALDLIEGLVGEVLSAGVPARRIALAGFSQGACLVLEHTARSARRYGWVAGLSGALIGPMDTPRGPADLAGTPILLGCAERDPHIPLEYVERSAEVLGALGAVVTKEIFPGAAHTLFPTEMAWMRQGLAGLRQDGQQTQHS